MGFQACSFNAQGVLELFIVSCDFQHPVSLGVYIVKQIWLNGF
jgi:hypothetical protein